LLPVILHAYNDPSVFLRLVHKRLRESADVRVREAAGGAVGVLALLIVVVDEHHQALPVPGLGPLEHLLVARRVAERGVRTLADEKVDSHGLTYLIIDEENLRLSK